MNVTNEVNMDEFDAAKVNTSDVGETVKNTMPGTSGTQKLDKNLDKLNELEAISKEEKVGSKPAKFDATNVCFFNVQNKCKFGKECRKEHPKICNKFKKFGLQKFTKNKNGCNEDCEFFHPKACLEAMKTKTCNLFENELGTFALV